MADHPPDERPEPSRSGHAVRFQPFETLCIAAGLDGALEPATGLIDHVHRREGATRVAARAAFKPIVPAPVAAAPLGAGEVVLFVDPEQAPRLAATAALAVLLKMNQHAAARSETGGRRANHLLIEVSDKYAGGAAGPSSGGPSSGGPTRIAGARVWRTGVAATGGRLRDWVLLLQECRTAYNVTAVAAGGDDAVLRARLASLADRTIVVTRPGGRSLTRARQQLRLLHDAGVARCECLWLDAA